MFDLLAESPQDRARLCGGGLSRREFLHVGALAAIGLTNANTHNKAGSGKWRAIWFDDSVFTRITSGLYTINLTTGAARLIDRRFAELPECITPGDLLVFNDTKVLKARFLGQKASGGKIEVLVERLTGERTALAQIRRRRKGR